MSCCGLFKMIKMMLAVQDDHKLEDWSDVALSNDRDSTFERPGKVENGDKETVVVSAMLNPAAKNEFLESSSILGPSRTDDSAVKNSVAERPQTKKAFRMSAQEDFLELDDDDEHCYGLAIRPLAEGRGPPDAHTPGNKRSDNEEPKLVKTTSKPEVKFTVELSKTTESSNPRVPIIEAVTNVASVDPSSAILAPSATNISEVSELKNKAEKEPNPGSLSGIHSAVTPFVATNSGSSPLRPSSSISNSSANNFRGSLPATANKSSVSDFGLVSQSTSIPAFSLPSISLNQPIFGNIPPSYTAYLSSGDQMNSEDSMAEDPVQSSAPYIPIFGLPTISPSPAGYMFGSTAPPLSNPYQYSGQQKQIAPLNPSPFQASGSLEFNSGGSFSLGSGGADKSNRKFVIVNRQKNRKK